MPATEADPGRQRHGGAPRGGLPVAREGPRLASVASRPTSATCSRLAPVGAPPSPRGWQQMKDRSPGRRKRHGSEESCGSERIAVRKSERVVAGTSGTGLFDIVNRGSAATRRPRSSGRQRLRVVRILVFWSGASGMLGQPATRHPCNALLPSPLWGGSTARAKRRRAGWGSSLLCEMCPTTTTPTPNPSPQGGGEPTEFAAPLCVKLEVKTDRRSARLCPPYATRRPVLFACCLQ